jgi:hypothetical protein
LYKYKATPAKKEKKHIESLETKIKKTAFNVDINMDNYTDIDVIVTFELDTNSKMKQSKIKNICEAECRSTFQD